MFVKCCLRTFSTASSFAKFNSSSQSIMTSLIFRCTIFFMYLRLKRSLIDMVDFREFKGIFTLINTIVFPMVAFCLMGSVHSRRKRNIWDQNLCPPVIVVCKHYEISHMTGSSRYLAIVTLRQIRSCKQPSTLLPFWMVERHCHIMLSALMNSSLVLLGRWIFVLISLSPVTLFVSTA